MDILGKLNEGYMRENEWKICSLIQIYKSSILQAFNYPQVGPKSFFF